MKIVIDARMYGLEHAGIGRYVINLIDQIEKVDKENDYFILLRKKYYSKLKFKNRRFKKILADEPHYSFAEQIILPIRLIKLKPDLVHFPHFNKPIFWQGRFILTIHDLIKHESKGAKTTTRWQPLYWLKYLAYKLVTRLAIRRAVKIIVPSKWWQTQLVKKYNLSRGKIVVIYEGVSKAFLKPKAEGQKKDRLFKKYDLKKPFFIYTGSLYPHKNVAMLVEAIKRLRLQLVVVCSRSVFYQRFIGEVKKIKAEKWVNFAGFVPDEELIVLYQEAEAFVLPSLLEGFGLIGLEAMAAGCPVIASKIPVLKEIYGPAALYFDPKSTDELVEKIRILVKNPKLKEKLKKLGFFQVRKYSWQKMAQETLIAYEDCLGLRPGE
ncbi:MAG TPA: glycosyltransferase family 1 protein [Candidatus Bathyarchaeia archaeon]|nr:glycosyltransferase family 1 protein [Candidatus Bathyarchaeia archaeon]